MASNQDDSREQAMRQALNLKRHEEKRTGEDAYLDVQFQNGLVELLFELKSGVEGKGFSTGRDTGVHTLDRWATMHFVFGSFKPKDTEVLRLWYGSPGMMRQWIEDEKKYLEPDLGIAGLIPQLVNEDTLRAVLGAKDLYTRAEIEALIKNVWNADKKAGFENQYKALATNPRAKKNDQLYTVETAMKAVRDRVAYLLDRGSTVNNRHVKWSYVIENCVELDGIEKGYAYSLREAITRALEKAQLG